MLPLKPLKSPGIPWAPIHQDGGLTHHPVSNFLRNTGKPYATLKDIRVNYEMACEDLSLKPSEDMEDFLQDLHDRKIIEIRSLREIGVSGVSTESLEQFLGNLLKRLEAELNGKR